jgi:sialic acid synthase SpsE
MNGLEIIAEIGVNHGGVYDTAVQLIHAARDAGCTTAKFQLFQRADGKHRQLELSQQEIAQLREACALDGIRFLCTPDTIADARFLKRLEVERIKIGSSNLTNTPMLKEVAGYGLPIILSTGACQWPEIGMAVHILRDVDLTLLHCVSAYPPPNSQMNLGMIKALYQRFRRPVGFSDHTQWIDCALIALGLGARVFEKHLKLADYAGVDHEASITPVQMKCYVECLCNGVVALGDGHKRIMPCEERNRSEYEQFVRQQYADSLTA